MMHDHYHDFRMIVIIINDGDNKNDDDDGDDGDDGDDVHDYSGGRMKC
jgi:hypothetical protein